MQQQVSSYGILLMEKNQKSATGESAQNVTGASTAAYESHQMTVLKDLNASEVSRPIENGLFVPS